MTDFWAYEKKAAGMGYCPVAGVDEAGRGPLAGPVVAAAVILPADFDVPGVDDSKKLTPRKRERLFDDIRRHARATGVGVASPERIDRDNILQASLWAMAEAVAALSLPPAYLLVDGIFTTPAPMPQEAVKKGDSRSISIAAASIIAKVTRDRMMADYDRKYPQYGFAGHKGYPTKRHREAIRRHGVSPIHRKTFRGVKEHLAPS